MQVFPSRPGISIALVIILIQVGVTNTFVAISSIVTSIIIIVITTAVITFVCLIFVVTCIIMWCRTADSVHVGPAGVLALPPHITRPTLEAMLTEARDFVAEWQEMRPVFQHRLFGQCLRPPLQVEHFEVASALGAGGGAGGEGRGVPLGACKRGGEHGIGPTFQHRLVDAAPPPPPTPPSPPPPHPQNPPTHTPSHPPAGSACCTCLQNPLQVQPVIVGISLVIPWWQSADSYFL